MRLFFSIAFISVIIVFLSSCEGVNEDFVVSQGSEESNNNLTQIPDYYFEENYLEKKTQSIIERNEFINGISFAFITDLHFLDNAKNSKYLLAYVLNNTNVPFVLSGGDYVQAWGGNDCVRWAENLLLEYQNYIGSGNWFSIRGNHDFTIKHNVSDESKAPGTGYTAQTPEVYNYLMRGSERFITSAQAGEMYYYLDIPAQRTRIFMLNSCVGQSSDETASWAIYNVPSQEEIDWLLTHMQDVTNYRFIFLSHIPCDNHLFAFDGNQSIFQDIFLSIKHKTVIDIKRGNLSARADFSASSNTAICWIGGHGHRDMSHRDAGFLSIMTTSDAAFFDDGWGDVPGQKPTMLGDITEQAFDVYHINYDRWTIKTTRIGRGMDREWDIDGTDTGRNDGTGRSLSQMWHGDNMPSE